MGTILKTKFYLKYSASIELGSTKKSNAPFIIQDPTLSPGWTLAVKITPFLLCKFSIFYLEVIVRTSHLLPANVSVNVFFCTYCYLIGSDIIAFNSSISSV